jgi:hypothetical protein
MRIRDRDVRHDPVDDDGSAVVILASPNTPAHSLKLRLVVMTTLVRS